jgi:hypothetical protein
MKIKRFNAFLENNLLLLPNVISVESLVEYHLELYQVLLKLCTSLLDHIMQYDRYHLKKKTDKMICKTNISYISR